MKFTRQFDHIDCGPACICMVASALGKNYPLAYVRSLARLTREGVSVSGIRKALSALHIDSQSFEMTLEQLRDLCPLPAILHWDQNHFVVLLSARRHPLTQQWHYRVANPAFDKQTLSEAEFTAHWRNDNGKGIVIAVEATPEFSLNSPPSESHSFRRFARHYVWPFKWQLIQSGLAMLLGLLLSLVMPFLTQAMVDGGIGLRDVHLIFMILAAQLFLFTGSFSMNLISSWVSLYMSTRISINILSDYLSKLLRLPFSFYDTKSVGDYQQRIDDHARLQNFITYGSLETFFSLVAAPFYMLIIGWYNPLILLVYLLFTLTATVWTLAFFNRRKALDFEQFQLSARNQNRQYEMLAGVADIKLNCFANYELKQWHDLQERQYHMSRRILRLNQLQQTGYTFISQLRNICITCWVALQVVNGQLTLGMMMSIAAIIGLLNGPLSQLISFMQQLQEARISLERSEEVQLCPDEDCDATVQHDRNIHDIDLRNVSFSYEGEGGRLALDDVSLYIPAGSLTAIVGESGSGKTTLMKLLMKYYAPTKGDIYLGKHNLRDINAESLRIDMGIVMQDGFLYSDTIRRNLFMGDTEIPDEEVYPHELQMCKKMACLSDLIDGLPLGFNTKVGSEGMGLSGGEKQRLLIARALCKYPSYFLFDEATSALDAENERKITDNINSFFRDRTRIVIAHRLSTVKNADQIAVLRHGQIVELGTHAELVARRGYYYNLVKNQLDLPDA